MQSTSLNIALASFSIAPLAEVVSQVLEVALHIYIYIYIYIHTRFEAWGDDASTSFQIV